MPDSGYLAGRGIADITGEIAECGMLGYGMKHQQSAGLHLRLRARAFAFAPSGPAAPGEHGVLLVVCDLPLMFGTVVQEVLPRLSPGYDEAHVMITATHTHCGPGGYSLHALYNSNTGGFRPKTHAAIVDGIVEAATLAHHDLAPAFGGWFLGRLAVLARHQPGLFLRLATSELPGTDRRALAQPGMREAFLVGYGEALRQGSRGVAQDLRVLTRPWGFELDSITVSASIHHGDADTTVPPQHAQLFAAAIPGAQLQIHPGHGHLSILAAARQILAPLAA